MTSVMMMTWRGSIGKFMLRVMHYLGKHLCVLNESVKITLFRSFFTHLYTCELWWQYRSESLRKLCVAYNNVFRFLCSEPRICSAGHMFVSRGLPTCNMLIRKSIYAFMTSTKRSCNTILQNIVGSDHLQTRPHCSSIGGVCYMYIQTSLFSFLSHNRVIT